MAQDYYTILTNAGLAYEAQQKAQNKPITLVTMAIGDGNGAAYNPDPMATTLRREVHRQPINSLLQDANNPTWLVAEVWLADEVGGWTIREVGIYTDTGVLYAIAKYPESIKPLLASGSGKQFYVRTIFQTSNTSSVVLQVDNSVVIATRAFVEGYVRDELAKLDSKQSVRVATAGNIALTGLQTIDGVVLAAGDRVLVKDQAAAKDNGIYIAAGGVWTRAADADSGLKLNPGAIIPVEAGSSNGDTQWTLKTDGPVTVGTTALSFQWTGGLNAPNQVLGDNSQKIANTAFVRAAIAALVSSSPAALDTLNELAEALGNDPNFATTVTNSLAGKQPLDATLTAIAGLATAANQLIYSTGVDTFATSALTTFARSLLDDADAAAARLTLGAAPLASPNFTGTPAAPTAAAGTNTTQLATTAFVQAAVAALVASSPAALDTLKELAAALGNDANFAATMANALAAKAPLASPALTGVPTTPTPVVSDSSAQIANTAFVRSLLSRTVRDVTTSRSVGVTYTNNTPSDILVNVAGGAAVNQATATILVDGVEFVGSSQSVQGLSMSVSAVVPTGKTYKLPAGNFSIIAGWKEVSL